MMNDQTRPNRQGSLRLVRCPACEAEVEWRPENTFRPFCSARCKGVDLGAWAREQYRVAAEDNPQVSDDQDD